MDTITNSENNFDSVVTIASTETQVNIFEGATAEPMNDLFMVLGFFNNSNKLNKLLNKLSVNLDPSKQIIFFQVIKMLTESNTKLNNIPEIKNIIEQIKLVFSDGKLDMEDVPELVNIITNLLNINFSKLKISLDFEVASTVIKVLIHVLLELKIIVVQDQTTQSLNRMIDSSIRLLNTAIRVKTNCGLFSCLAK